MTFRIQFQHKPLMSDMELPHLLFSLLGVSLLWLTLPLLCSMEWECLHSAFAGEKQENIVQEFPVERSLDSGKASLCAFQHCGHCERLWRGLRMWS